MEDCVFCMIAGGSAPSMKIYEDEWAVAFMDIAGDVDGHIVAIPKTHCISVLDCGDETLTGLMRAVKRISEHLVNDCGYTGVNLLNASGVSAGQSIAHFHIHIIPRKEGDGIDAWPRFDGAEQDIREIFGKIRMTEQN